MLSKVNMDPVVEFLSKMIINFNALLCSGVKLDKSNSTAWSAPVATTAFSTKTEELTSILNRYSTFTVPVKLNVASVFALSKLNKVSWTLLLKKVAGACAGKAKTSNLANVMPNPTHDFVTVASLTVNTSNVPAPFRVLAKTTANLNPLRCARSNPLMSRTTVWSDPVAVIVSSRLILGAAPSIFNTYSWPATPLKSNVAVVLVPSNASSVNWTFFSHQFAVVPLYVTRVPGDTKTL